MTSPLSTNETVHEAVREVYGPELGGSVIDLDLVYRIAVDDTCMTC